MKSKPFYKSKTLIAIALIFGGVIIRFAVMHGWLGTDESQILWDMISLMAELFGIPLAAYGRMKADKTLTLKP